MPNILCPRCGEQNDTEQTGVRCRQCSLPLPVLSLDPPEAVVPGLPVQAPALAPELPDYTGVEPLNVDIAQPTLRVTEEEVQAFVGSGASYYLARWQSALAHGGQPTGFNLAACLFAGLWLPYRKLYAATGLFFACVIGLALLERFVLLQMVGLAELPGWSAVVTTVAVGVFIGVRANHLYWNKTREAIWRVRRRGLPDDEHYRELARQGGTSVSALVAGSLAGLVAVVVANVLLDRLPAFNEIRRMEEAVRTGMEKDQKIRAAACRLERRPDGTIAGTVTEVGGAQWEVLRVWAEGRQVRWYFAEPVARVETRMRAEIVERVGDPIKSAQLQRTPEGRVTGTIETQAGIVCDVLQTPPDVFPPLVYWQINERSYPSYIKVATRKDDFSLVNVRLEPKGKNEWRGEGTDNRGFQYDIALRTRSAARGGAGDVQSQMLEWDLMPKAVPLPQMMPAQRWPGNQPAGPVAWPPGWRPPWNPFGRPQPLQPGRPIVPHGPFP